MNTTTIGAAAELAAKQWLEKQGLKCRAQNISSHFGEIDLIMQDQDYMVFVEVRLRNNDNYASALESITRQKQQRIKKTAMCYLQKEQLVDKIPCRFDVIAASNEDNQFTFNWIRNAF
jgi:putative endonuclease